MSSDIYENIKSNSNTMSKKTKKIASIFQNGGDDIQFGF